MKHDIIDHSDFQNSFKVLMISSTKSESSPSPACLESSPSPNVWDSSLSPSPNRLGLESDSSPSPRTRVPISGSNKIINSHFSS